MPSSMSARIYITLVALAGTAAFALALAHPAVTEPAGFAALLVVAVITSRMKVRLPGMKANMSVSLPFLLLASAQMRLFPALMIAVAATVVQSINREMSSAKLVQTLFNVATVILAMTAAYALQHNFRVAGARGFLLLLAGATVYLLINTALVAGVVSLTGDQNLGKAWTAIFSLTYLYYLLSATMAAVVLRFDLGWNVLLPTLVVVYGAYRSFQMYFVTMSSVMVPETASAGD